MAFNLFTRNLRENLLFGPLNIIAIHSTAPIMEKIMQKASISGILAIALVTIPSSAMFATPPPKPTKPTANRSTITSTQIASQFVSQLKAQKFTEAAQRFDPTMKAAVSPQQLQQIWQSLTVKAGSCTQSLPPTVDELGNTDIVYVPCVFGTTTLDLKIVVVAQKIAGFFIVPHVAKKGYVEAPYAVSTAFVEQSTSIPSAVGSLGATWSVPSKEGVYPVVVLVHGSGPQDRDESIGANKPFRDLAHGLASNGIAVLRYEKRTKQNPTNLGVDLNKLTVKEETIDDALSAVRVARGFANSDKQRIYVLGHSLGGMLLPRIAQGDSEIAGFISLAGNARPLTDLLVEQMEYIATTSAENGAAVKKQLPAIKQQVARIKDPALSESTPAKDLMGVPAAYWLDLRSYDPAEAMKSVAKPVLFLQGGRDYQVTASGDFRKWQEALKGKSNCTFKIYPKLNHIFVVGEGVATPEEYLTKTGNVSDQVIKDIADWVKQH